MRLHRLPAFLLGALLLLAAAPRASAQLPSLDETWFKVSIKLKGAAITPLNEAEKAAGAVTVYVFVEDLPLLGDPPFPGVLHDYLVVSEVTPGNWAITGGGRFRLSGQNGEVMTADETGSGNRGVELDVVVPDEDSTELLVTFVGAMKAKADGEGALKKAAFKSAGGMVVEGFGDGDVIVGGAKVKGASVAVEKLPFDPGTLKD